MIRDSANNGAPRTFEERLQRARAHAEQAKDSLVTSLSSLRHSVDDTISLGYWASRRPWPYLLGALALGFWLGHRLLERKR